jgi:hypothetical protein
MDPRERARRNLVVFWLVVVGIPVVIIWGCTTFHLSLSNMA